LDTEKIAAARAKLEAKWDDEGDCGSCGWHACLYEHHVSDEDIQSALEDDAGWLHLSCISKDWDEGDRCSHRGIKVYIGE
jgi:hypothetical protein